LGARVTFSRACRPSRTAHLTLSPGLTPGLDSQIAVGGVSLTAHPLPEEQVHRLPPTLRTATRKPTPGCGKAPRGLLSLRGDAGLCTGSVGFTGTRAGTVGPSLIHSCAPELSVVGSQDMFLTQGLPPYPARHLATLRGSELPPAFSGASPGCTRASRTASGQDSPPVLTLSG
jgi:hypothetical protein